MATINDFGATSDPLSAPALGGPSGWAAAVRDALNGKAATGHIHTGTYWKQWSGTQAAYDAITTKDTNTLYVVTG
jgi:hypothetical protein